MAKQPFSRHSMFRWLPPFEWLRIFFVENDRLTNFQHISALRHATGACHISKEAAGNSLEDLEDRGCLPSSQREPERYRNCAALKQVPRSDGRAGQARQERQLGRAPRHREAATLQPQGREIQPRHIRQRHWIWTEHTSGCITSFPLYKW